MLHELVHHFYITFPNFSEWEVGLLPVLWIHVWEQQGKEARWPPGPRDRSSSCQKHCSVSLNQGSRWEGSDQQSCICFKPTQKPLSSPRNQTKMTGNSSMEEAILNQHSRMCSKLDNEIFLDNNNPINLRWPRQFLEPRKHKKGCGPRPSAVLFRLQKQQQSSPDHMRQATIRPHCNCWVSVSFEFQAQSTGLCSGLVDGLKNLSDGFVAIWFKIDWLLRLREGLWIHLSV